MTQAKHGDTVKVHYTGRFDDGQVFDSSSGREPLQFTIGQGQIIPGFEAAVVGMVPGQTKTEKIPSDQAYGNHDQNMVAEIERKLVPEGLNPEIGQELEMEHPNGETIPVIVTNVNESHVTIDANHPLAGKDLTFDIELLEIG
ncbi:MAG: peptidylprolyl isomerase [candidate division Zixibacteria bacterium]|nr:peptidylprolyl isomerase [candidate division Zixibacteria bacterium]